LDGTQRSTVERTIREVANHRGWEIHALHVRTNHVHVVVTAQEAPERVMSDFKSYATRRLREGGLVGDDVHPWSRHGSTRYLWNERDIADACEYVDERQGAPLSDDEGKNPLPYGRGSVKARRPLGEISGEDAFKLHDTYGFPIDLTELMAEERGLTVNIGAYERLMEEARQKARGKRHRIGADHFDLEIDIRSRGPTEFIGYTILSSEAHLLAIFGADDEGVIAGEPIEGVDSGRLAALALEKSPFYPERGGQVGDKGEIRFDSLIFAVTQTQDWFGTILHIGRCEKGQLAVWPGDIDDFDPDELAARKVVASVNPSFRNKTSQNHTATHVMNWALREVLGDHVQQKGSLVDPDKTRFDLSHHAQISDDELVRIESLVNERIADELPVYTNDNVPVSQRDAIKINGLRAVFGEKYPDEVRVVSIGVPVTEADAAKAGRSEWLLKTPDNPEWRKYSIEFCGGTHVKRTGEIERFRLIEESAVARGIRRVIGITGDRARAAERAAADLACELEAALASAENPLPDGRGSVNPSLPDGRGSDKRGAGLSEPRPSGSGFSSIEAAVSALSTKLANTELPVVEKIRLRAKLAELQELAKKQKKEVARAGAADAMARADELLAGGEKFGGVTVICAALEGATVDQLRAASDSLRSRAGSAAILLATHAESKVVLLAAMTPDVVQRGVKAGDLIRQIAPIVGGSGGGRPDMAQGGGSDPSKIDAALAAAAAWLKGRLL
jgi:alanyl-tRNA synthetase